MPICIGAEVTGQCRKPWCRELWSRLDTSGKAFWRRWREADPGCELEKSGEVSLRRNLAGFLLGRAKASFYAEGEVGAYVVSEWYLWRLEISP